jgi:hypothetical protein
MRLQWVVSPTFAPGPEDLTLPAPLESRQQPLVRAFIGRSNANPFDRHCVQLRFIGRDTLAHGLNQPLYLVLAA